MKALLYLGALCALLATGTASAVQARHYIDTDLRASAAAPSGQPRVIAVDAAGAALLAHEPAVAAEPSAQQQHPTAQPVISSPVPEPSGVAMLCCGLLLLVLAPGKNRQALFAISGKRSRAK